MHDGRRATEPSDRQLHWMEFCRVLPAYGSCDDASTCRWIDHLPCARKNQNIRLWRSDATACKRHSRRLRPNRSGKTHRSRCRPFGYSGHISSGLDPRSGLPCSRGRAHRLDHHRFANCLQRRDSRARSWQGL